MQSKTVNRSVLPISLLLFNGMVLAIVRPFNLLGSFVMIVTEITILLLVVRVLRKYPRYRIF